MQTSIEIVENAPVGTILIEITISDKDPCAPNNQIYLQIFGDYSEYFSIVKNDLILVKEIDFETLHPQFILEIVAKERLSEFETIHA